MKPASEPNRRTDAAQIGRTRVGATRWFQAMAECQRNPCCNRAGEYNGFGSGPLIFTCPKNCMCHD